MQEMLMNSDGISIFCFSYSCKIADWTNSTKSLPWSLYVIFIACEHETIILKNMDHGLQLTHCGLVKPGLYLNQC